MKPDAIFFDAGGTLVLQHPEDIESLLRFPVEPDRAFEAHYRAIAEFSMRKTRGETVAWEWWLERYFGLLGHPEPAMAGPAIDNGRGLWRYALPGVAAAVERVRSAGVRVAVISNSDGSVAGSLAEAGLAAMFENIIDSAVVGISKPEPGIFDLACDRLGVGPDRSWYIGDSEYHDIAGALAAGFAAAWLVDPLDLGAAEQRVKSVADLPDLIG